METFVFWGIELFIPPNIHQLGIHRNFKANKHFYYGYTIVESYQIISIENMIVLGIELS